ncbi:putative E3 ubiquitin-protein ligase UBR7 [Phlebotomus argentipes]|uniref:putative E3 ubiquitin-protein ligase UBR7 n=1 Tax=Phlebotomus argentipes TaxID=94469 RepID=UPI002893268D|nr:putative E3 ubiquitin-protein ligase UBR7 [Phlebotomus argentipes]
MAQEQDPSLNESSVTMLDVLDEEQALEEESLAVLGGSDDKFCTYSKGYVKRQALYSCLTCSPESSTDTTKCAGVCLACSYHCHEGHELVELYTKRNFRCDCGGVRMPDVKCSLEPEKGSENTENHYNQNFSGLYCSCHRPYPDPEDPIEDEMIQCIICEDWLHCRHLEIAVPTGQTFFEMICAECSEKNDVLHFYLGLSVGRIENECETVPEIALNVEDTSATEEKKEEKLDSEDKSGTSEPTNDTEVKEKVVETKEPEQSTSSMDDKEPEAKRAKLDIPEDKSDVCKRPTLKLSHKRGATFWPENWREQLCKCSECQKIYAELKVVFLLDLDDTVQSYEEHGKNKAKESDYDRGMRALSSMDRTRQIDAISAYNRMREKLKEYLHTFVANRQVVTEEDVRRFFRMMKNEKNENLGQPYFCR